mmetsp:Transcript_25034/g.61717  ORF Transcript_25034/g.61717 Transcript_25034/m.61717 type:complete len:117 (-) Transcript_25034:465-815(-)
MKARSWLTRSTVVVLISFSFISSHSTPSTLRWFVGSSRISRSGSSMSAAASATRLRCPPLSSPMRRSMKSVQPSCSSAACALVSVSHALSESISSSTSPISFASTSPLVAAAMYTS